MQRSALLITLSVWKALFLREALTRLFGARGAWFWLLAEPVFQVTIMMFFFAVIRMRHVGGMDVMVWLMLGFLAFFMFSRTSAQTSNALSANKALFAYRQVKPVDPVLVRGVLEGFLLVLVCSLLTSGMALAGKMAVPSEPLRIIGAVVGLWVLGLGWGLMLSVCSDLLPELARLIRLLTIPLMIVSGVIFPISALVQPYRDWLLLNPIAHGIEEVRAAYSASYYAVPELDISYMFFFSLVLVFLGLALHARYEDRLIAA